MNDIVHMDENVLVVLQDVMQESYSELLSTFLQDSEYQVKRLQSACASANEISLAAHTFKGSCSNMGAVHLAGLCRALEDQARLSGDGGNFTSLIAQVVEEFDTVRALYAQELQRVSPVTAA
ncbi:Hpt domain-containing protein [Pseudomonas sp. nanlin1]|uniref:Hpt domain-containing protein n=1 Tax=Pseudomonas sp. nanlin1 TaxID=3040605 RepID=UPI00388FE719